MTLIHVLVCVVVANCALAASIWDDLTDNLGTDLTPILQLFGEQVTKQYLSENTSFWDCVIFAMAPVGILTAIVSVIRVCGDSLLKAFIGRAQESAGVAELELCSSTGRDIVELVQGGAVTRVFGRAKILEIIHDPSLEESKPGHIGDATAGIYTFTHYQDEHPGSHEWEPYTWPREWNLSDKETLEDKRKEIIKNIGHAKNPNLMLNVGLGRPQRWLVRFIAVLSVLLQVSMLVFAGWATFVKKLHRENSLPPTLAFCMTIIGTVLLCLGMLLCAHLIERSTNECTFIRKKPSDVARSRDRSLDEESGLNSGRSDSTNATTNGVSDSIIENDHTPGDARNTVARVADKAIPLVPLGGIEPRGEDVEVGPTSDLINRELSTSAVDGVTTSMSGITGSVIRPLDSPHTTLYWVQPGEQIIGDQTFESFIYSDKNRPLPYYTISWRRLMGQQERTMTWIASSFTIAAFVIQFVGLRGLHSSVSLYQTAIVLIMSTLRASLRTKRLNPSERIDATNSDHMSVTENMEANEQRRIASRGHELDILAFQIFEDGYKGKIKEVQFPRLWVFTHQILGSRRSEPDSERYLFVDSEPFRAFGRLWIPVRANHVGDLNTHTASRSIPSQLWRYRARLGHLTSANLQKVQSQEWSTLALVRGRPEADSAAQVISAAVSLIISNLRNSETYPWGNRGKQFRNYLRANFTFYLDLKCLGKVAHQGAEADGTTPEGSCLFTITRRLDRAAGINQIWAVYPAEIEAALSLTTWSCLDQVRAATAFHGGHQDSTEPEHMSIVAGTNEDQDSAKDLISQLALWACMESYLISSSEYIHANVTDVSSRIAIFWDQSTNDDGLSPPLFEPTDSPTGKSKRLFGWPTVIQALPSTSKPFVLAVLPTDQPFITLCAQELFATFVQSMAQSTGLPFGKFHFTDKSGSVGIENEFVTKMMDLFMENKLGSRLDALFCIVPTVVAISSDLPLRSALQEMLRFAEDSFSGHNSNTANMGSSAWSEVIRWGIHSVPYISDESQIWDWFLVTSWMCITQGFNYLDEELFQVCKSLKCTEELRKTIKRLTDRLPEERERAQLNVLLADFIKRDDHDGMLLHIYLLLDKTKKLDLNVPLALIQKGSTWQLVIRAISKRRNIFALYDSEGRSPLTHALADGGTPAAERLFKMCGGERYFLQERDKNNCNILHRIIAGSAGNVGNRLEIIEWLVHLDRSMYLFLGDYQPFFEALGSADDSDHIMHILDDRSHWRLENIWVDSEKEAQQLLDGQTPEGSELAEPWIKGWKKLREFRKKLKNIRD
ncbi:hypothetical protein T440DRAFT_512849 [Plenodomus tracheiphilus IPT5]|uniref:Ankyrin repeat protein n=1 Tax=Plenodomus tracheiphilus IPT5 TaxID=1408161 RepID=A0A6A7BND0_9PLEO|nr:hypothetical protein T440DRAFT_512849 [Plenodomus tracheiphilus IPT5]